MKRLIGIAHCLMLSLIAMAGIHSYADQSVLREGNVVKVRVRETGIHCIPFDTLKAWGLRPTDVRVLGYGGQMLSENFTLKKWDDLPSVAFYMHKGTDGIFNSGDYILFYAQGVVRWDAVDGRWQHTQNPYSQYGYYFISDSAGEQRIISTNNTEYDTTDCIDVDWYTYYAVHEKDTINLVDPTGVNGGGREFYGEPIDANKPKITIQFPTTNVRTDLESTCHVNMAVTASTTSNVHVKFNGASADFSASGIAVSDFYTKAVVTGGKIQAKATTTGQQVVEIAYNNTTSGAVTHLNYVAVNIPCNLKMDKNGMAISNISYLNKSSAIRFHMSNASSNTQIWRVTDGVNISLMKTHWENNKLIWIGNNTKAEKYIAITPTLKGWHSPVKVGKVANQNLHALQNIDYVIICPSEFIDAATRLAKKHEEVDALTWAVVTDEQVYNEFSSGTPDASAYRWLMKMLYDRAKSQKDAPKHLLLLGKGTFDNRKIYRNSGEAKLLTYQAYNSTKETLAYATDDYFGFMQDTAGIEAKTFNEVYAKMDIGVGRLPAKTLEEANNMVDKLCKYMDNQSLGKWKSQILFLADDGDHGLHVETADKGAELLRKENKMFVVNKIYLDAHSQEVTAAGESYPIAKNQFDNLMNNGVLFMNYSGHGGFNNITTELLMKTADIKRMSNVHQAFWFLATCSFSHCDGGVVSAGEEAILNPNGAAIGVLSACRTVYATQNTILNTNLCDTLFGHNNRYNYHMTIGEATRIAKNKTGRDTNKLPYVLLGDPALRLNYPCDYFVKTTTHFDTIQALSKQTIQGYIQTADQDTAHWFNGKVDVTVFDKMQVISTRDNDEADESKKVIKTFNDYPNIIFAGQTDVVDGKFEFTFIVPKDIRYNYGNGRIAYYAHDPELQKEAIGYFEDFTIGGSSTVEIQDTIGPELNIYLNNPAFIDGSKTYEYPHFYAEIYDENGINTIGTGIGHDLLMVIDNDPKQTYVLNNYFTAGNNSYQEGLVSYKMSQQEAGAHSLIFRAWDLYNNSSTATLNYHVVKGLGPQIYNIITYPNPVSRTNILYIDIAHDQPNETIETLVYLYNVSGELVHIHKQIGTETISLNIGEISLTSGIYIYQVNIKTASSKYSSYVGKIIIK